MSDRPEAKTSSHRAADLTSAVPRAEAAGRPPTDPRATPPIESIVLGDVPMVVIRLRDPDPSVEGLTSAEREVAELLLRGLSNHEIAEARGTSSRTVANQLRALYGKLEVSSRFELVRRLLEPPG